MTKKQTDIRAQRLSSSELEDNFADINPPLSRTDALIESDRCYFCFDAPCTTACPTGIDIPGFIRQIQSDNLMGSARLILEENIMGGMCARVCPTEILCEDACVRNTQKDGPVEIGLLQRHATEPVYQENKAMFERGEPSGKRVAVVGGGPAGLSCAHGLSRLGHDVVIFNKDERLGGLNEYGIAAYKTLDDFAQREVDWILSIGGIKVKQGVVFGVDISLNELLDSYDAVFLSVGLANAHSLGLNQEELSGVESAIHYISELRQVEDKGELLVGNRVVVIGGGMTAIDIAVQSRKLGAQFVDIVYRRGVDDMGASEHEQDIAQSNGVRILNWLSPVAIHGDTAATSIEFEKTAPDDNGKPVGTGERLMLEADVIFEAVGQKLDESTLSGIESENGRIVVDAGFATTLDRVWAGGDCVGVGDNLTVSAVQHGKLAAKSIHEALTGGSKQGES